MIDYDWSRFQIVYYYKAGLSDLYRSWGTAAGLETFFLERAAFSRPPNLILRDSVENAEAGDHYRWRWIHDHEIQGKVLKAAIGDEFAFTFGSMAVSVRLRDFEGQVELTLTQTEIATSEMAKVTDHLNCRSCWTFFLTNLQSVLENGVDLRSRIPERASSMEVGFVPLSAVPSASS